MERSLWCQPPEEGWMVFSGPSAVILYSDEMAAWGSECEALSRQGDSWSCTAWKGDVGRAFLIRMGGEWGASWGVARSGPGYGLGRGRQLDQSRVGGVGGRTVLAV
jgi:hypothetical protein